MKILGPKDTGKGILVEWDAGIINPNEPRNQNIIRESYGQLDHSKPFVFYATLQKYGVPNRNGRIYPEKILKREAEKYQDIIKRGMSISELNHPESSLVDLDRVSHLITETWWEGNILMQFQSENYLPAQRFQPMTVGPIFYLFRRHQFFTRFGHFRGFTRSVRSKPTGSR